MQNSLDLNTNLINPLQSTTVCNSKRLYIDSDEELSDDSGDSNSSDLNIDLDKNTTSKKFAAQGSEFSIEKKVSEITNIYNQSYSQRSTVRYLDAIREKVEELNNKKELINYVVEEKPASELIGILAEFCIKLNGSVKDLVLQLPHRIRPLTNPNITSYYIEKVSIKEGNTERILYSHYLRKMKGGERTKDITLHPLYTKSLTLAIITYDFLNINQWLKTIYKGLAIDSTTYPSNEYITDEDKKNYDSLPAILYTNMYRFFIYIAHMRETKFRPLPKRRWMKWLKQDNDNLKFLDNIYPGVNYMQSFYIKEQISKILDQCWYVKPGSKRYLTPLKQSTESLIHYQNIIENSKTSYNEKIDYEKAASDIDIETSLSLRMIRDGETVAILNPMTLKDYEGGYIQHRKMQEKNFKLPMTRFGPVRQSVVAIILFDLFNTVHEMNEIATSIRQKLAAHHNEDINAIDIAPDMLPLLCSNEIISRKEYDRIQLNKKIIELSCGRLFKYWRASGHRLGSRTIDCWISSEDFNGCVSVLNRNFRAMLYDAMHSNKNLEKETDEMSADLRADFQRRKSILDRHLAYNCVTVQNLRECMKEDRAHIEISLPNFDELICLILNYQGRRYGIDRIMGKSCRTLNSEQLQSIIANTAELSSFAHLLIPAYFVIDWSFYIVNALHSLIGLEIDEERYIQRAVKYGSYIIEALQQIRGYQESTGWGRRFKCPKNFFLVREEQNASHIASKIEIYQSINESQWIEMNEIVTSLNQHFENKKRLHDTSLTRCATCKHSCKAKKRRERYDAMSILNALAANSHYNDKIEDIDEISESMDNTSPINISF